VSTPSKGSQPPFWKKLHGWIDRRRGNAPSPPSPHRKESAKAVNEALADATESLSNLVSSEPDKMAFYLLREEVQDLRRQFAALVAVDPGGDRNVTP
jgi:hypothetical protein